MMKLYLQAFFSVGASPLTEQDDVDILLAEPAWDEDDPDENHNDTKPSMRFLERHNGESNQRSPDRSPLEAGKPYVPPLDLSILHEHGDGSGTYKLYIT